MIGGAQSFQPWRLRKGAAEEMEKLGCSFTNPCIFRRVSPLLLARATLRNSVEMMEDIEYWWQSWMGKYYSRINGVSTPSCSGTLLQLHWERLLLRRGCICTPTSIQSTTWDLWSSSIIPGSAVSTATCCYWQTSIYSWVDSTNKFFISSDPLAEKIDMVC